MDVGGESLLAAIPEIKTAAAAPAHRYLRCMDSSFALSGKKLIFRRCDNSEIYGISIPVGKGKSRKLLNRQVW
jgi:hypothetical protein